MEIVITCAIVFLVFMVSLSLTQGDETTDVNTLPPPDPTPPGEVPAHLKKGTSLVTWGNLGAEKVTTRRGVTWYRHPNYSTLGCRHCSRSFRPGAIAFCPVPHERFNPAHPDAPVVHLDCIESYELSKALAQVTRSSGRHMVPAVIAVCKSCGEPYHMQKTTQSRCPDCQDHKNTNETKEVRKKK